MHSVYRAQAAREENGSRVTRTSRGSPKVLLKLVSRGIGEKHGPQ